MSPDIQTYISTHKYIPFPPTFPQEDIKQAIHELATSENTKWQQLFKRFYENDATLFRQFREVNSNEQQTKTAIFHEIGEQVVGKLRILEQILTDKMIKRDTDKTVTSFYNHVRLFFPQFDNVGNE